MACVGERHHSSYDSYKSSRPQLHVEPASSATLRDSDLPIDAPSPAYTLHEARSNVSLPSQPQSPERHSPQRASSSRPRILKRGSSYGTPYSPGGLASGEEEAFAQTLSWIPRTPYTRKQPRQRLEKPVAIPQVDGGGSSKYMPFTRAYSPVLQAHDVHVKEFIAFVDNLSVVQAPLPPFQTAGIVGMGISFVPHHWSKLIENDVSMAANTGSAMTSRARTDKYLKEANQRYFAPRGLKFRLVRDSELAQLVGCPDSFPSLGKAHCRHGSQPHKDRQLCVLDKFVSPLTYDVPPHVHGKILLDRISAKRVDTQLAKPYRRACKDQHKQLTNEEYKRDRRASAASVSTVFSSSESETDSDSEDVSKSDSVKESKPPELEIENIGLDSRSETSKAGSEDLIQAGTIEERRQKPTELAVKQHQTEQLQSTFISHDIAQGHKANSPRLAEKQGKNLMWIFIDNIDSDKLPQQE